MPSNAPEAAPASRRRHHEDPTLNRSLARGVEILRAFKPGAALLGNGELAERTGLSRATVSRLVQTLVDAGLLEHDRARRAYRLAAPLLSFAHAMRAGSPVLAVAAPRMRRLAEKLRVNVGLAMADRDEMVYLESVRYNRKVSLRNVVAGQRVPIELTSLGRAYLAIAPAAERRTLMALFRRRRRAQWEPLRRAIDEAAASVKAHGYCAASWQPEVVALATPIVVAGHPPYLLNISIATAGSLADAERELRAPLLKLAREIAAALAQLAA